MILDFEHLRDSDAATREEGELLYALVRATKPTYCVEIGTHRGFTAEYIGQALLHNAFGKLLTVDPINYGYSPSVTFVEYREMKGEDIKPEAPIDFLFIDGFHDDHWVEREMKALFPHLSPNALVVFHDCDINEENDTCGVNAAVKKAGLKTVFLPTKNRMRIYEHSGS